MLNWRRWRGGRRAGGRGGRGGFGVTFCFCSGYRVAFFFGGGRLVFVNLEKCSVEYVDVGVGHCSCKLDGGNAVVSRATRRHVTID